MGWTMDEEIEHLEQQTVSSRAIAIARIQSLEQPDNLTFAARFVPLLHDARESWMRILESYNISAYQPLSEEEAKESQCAKEESTRKRLYRLLCIHRQVTRHDSVLAEEMGRQGSHRAIASLLRWEGSGNVPEAINDDMLDLQDVAGEIASSGSFPSKVLPFTREELVHRLPLVCTISAPLGNQPDKNGLDILLHQVTERQSEQKDVGFGKYTRKEQGSAKYGTTSPMYADFISNFHAIPHSSLASGCGSREMASHPAESYPRKDNRRAWSRMRLIGLSSCSNSA